MLYVEYNGTNGIMNCADNFLCLEKKSSIKYVQSAMLYTLW